ncbi:prephenate/arogenate dehydrogenase [Cyanobium sp. Morenito 9A2]|uniref:prephenate/arogenate dehydrogenase n=1 Tax=Cyanobium sp. Morenito 9A2 TaxID=2823718 RepID=UPI0037BE8C96
MVSAGFQHGGSVGSWPEQAVPAMTELWRERPVGIVGLGLIGGSLALDLRAHGARVHALVHRQTTAQRAIERGLADRIATDSQVLVDCDLVVLALPLDRLLNPAPALLEALPAGAVLTDVGSVKAPVLDRWQPLWPRFVAGHPMAGTALAGVEAGQRELFKGRPWVATPAAETDPEALEQVKALAEVVGARWITCAAAAHDRAVALISHLPVLVSAALLLAADHAAPDPELAGLVRALASSGFADTTRVGGGNPELGTLMATHNQAALGEALLAYGQQLGALQALVQQGRFDQLEASLRLAQELRPPFL